MRKVVQHKPPYALESVDRALRLIQILRDTGEVRLVDAAAELGVSPSTAHRLFAMLVYRGFAVQDDSKTYVPGPAVGAPSAGTSHMRDLIRICRPHLELLAGSTSETTHLVFRMGAHIRYLDTVEGTHVLRVTDQTGSIVDARRSSAGKALLAEMDPLLLSRMFQPAGESSAAEEVKFKRLLQDLEQCRRLGFATNVETFDEIGAVGAVIHGSAGKAVAAVSVAMPMARYEEALRGGLVDSLRTTVASIEEDLRITMAPQELPTATD
jgi:IclR family transcriptional regulator, acetate operon repressor